MARFRYHRWSFGKRSFQSRGYLANVETDGYDPDHLNSEISASLIKNLVKIWSIRRSLPMRPQVNSQMIWKSSIKELVQEEVKRSVV